MDIIYQQQIKKYILKKLLIFNKVTKIIYSIIIISNKKYKNYKVLNNNNKINKIMNKIMNKRRMTKR